MESKWIIVAVCALYALYSFWPSIKGYLPSLSGINLSDIGGDEEDDRFKAYRVLRDWATELEGPQAEEACDHLCKLVPILFGPKDVEGDES